MKCKRNQGDLMRLANTFTGLQMPLEAKKILDRLIKDDHNNGILRSHRLVVSSTVHDWEQVVPDTTGNANPSGRSYGQQRDIELPANAYFHKGQYAKL